METARIGLAGMRIEGEDYGEAEPGSPVRGVATGEEEAVGGEANARPPRRRGEMVKREAPLRRTPLPPRDEKQRPPSPARSSAPSNLGEALGRPLRCLRRRNEYRSHALHIQTAYPRLPIHRTDRSDISIRVRAPTDGLKWPLRVYGHIATRDSMDQNRNYLFRRIRDICQTLTQDDPSLLLTGPSRAIMYLAPITFEVQLKVKGKGESEDEMLAFGAFYYDDGSACERKLSICYDHKRCMLEYEVALRPRSVEATISLKVVEGSWPENHRGIVVAITSGIDEKIILLRCRDSEPPIDPDGAIELSRRVVSVDLREKLLVAVDASLSGFLTRATAVFKPACSGMSHGVCDLGSCKVQVTVAWSLFVIVVP